jgi:hypothetical protein
VSGTTAGKGASRDGRWQQRRAKAVARGDGGRVALEAHHLAAIGAVRMGGRPGLLKPPQRNINEPPCGLAPAAAGKCDEVRLAATAWWVQSGGTGRTQQGEALGDRACRCWMLRDDGWIKFGASNLGTRESQDLIKKCLS